MYVALRREAHDRAVPAARDDDRQLSLQRQHLLQHAGHALQISPGGGQFSRGFDAHLALAVVAHARGFQNTGQQIRWHGLQLRGSFDHGVRRAAHAGHAGACHEVRLFVDAVLRNRHGSGAGRDRARGGQCLQ